MYTKSAEKQATIATNSVAIFVFVCEVASTGVIGDTVITYTRHDRPAGPPQLALHRCCMTLKLATDITGSKRRVQMALAGFSCRQYVTLTKYTRNAHCAPYILL